MCFTCALLLISSCASSPSNPSALLANGRSCSALYCSSWIQLSQELVIGISAASFALIAWAALTTSCHVAGGLSGIEARLAERILAVPHHRGGGVERHRRHPPIRQAVIAAHRGDVGLRDRSATPVSLISSHTCFVALPAASIDAGADLEDLREMRRLAGAERGDRRGQHVGIAALVDRLHLDRVLALVERVGELVDLFAECRGHRMPPDDLGLARCGPGRIAGAAASAVAPASRVRRFMLCLPCGRARA